MTGNTSSSLHYTGDIFLMKTDLNGKEVWNRTYLKDEHAFGAKGRSVQQTSDGGYIIAGYSSYVENTTPLMIKTDSQGHEIWRYSADIDSAALYCVRQTTNGGFVAAGNKNHWEPISDSDALLVRYHPDSPMEKPPIVNAYSISSLTAHSATLVGNVKANDVNATYYFEYESTGGSRSLTPKTSVESPFFPIVQAEITGLKPDTTYHYRLVATNSYGKTYGPDLTFKTPKWVLQITGNYIYSLAIDADGTIYIDSLDDKLYAINSDGTRKWDLQLVSSQDTSPVIGSDGTIYIVSEDGNLYAIGQDGTVKWSFQTEDAFSWTPAIGPDDTIYIGSPAGKLYAINADGSQKWLSQTGDFVCPSPVIGSDGTIYIGSDDGTFYAIDSDGTIRWEFQSNDPAGCFSSPAIASDGTLYLGTGGSDDTFYAISQDGIKKWEFPQKLYYGWGSPVIGSDGTIYAGSHNIDKKIEAINPDGSSKWAFQLGTGTWGFTQPIIGSDGVIYVASNSNRPINANYDDDDGKIEAINPDGTRKWQFPTGDYRFSSPIIGSDGDIYIGGDDKLYAFNSSSAGLADSPWPMFQKNPQHTGSVLGASSAVAAVKSVQVDINQLNGVEVGDSVTFTANAAGNQNAYYRFDLIPNYGTESYDPFNNWQLIQDFSPSNSTTYTFNNPGSYVFVVKCSLSPNVLPSTLAIIGGSVTVKEVDSQSEDTLSLTSLDMDLAGDPVVGDTVTFTASALSSGGSEVLYRFDLIADYGTADYDPNNNYTVIQDFSTDDSCSYTFVESGSYVILARAVQSDSIKANTAPAIIGGSITVLEK